MYIISHYKSSYDWVNEYTNDFVVYSKDELNVGYNIYDMMKFIVDNYDKLPDVCVFVKDNVLERHVTKEEFEAIKDRKTFTPILTKNHKTYLPVCYYENGLFCEINNAWYMNEHENRYFSNYKEFAEEMGLPNPDYLCFAPGGNYIVPRENILKHPKEFYEKLLNYVSYTQLPAEAHLIERSLYNIWS